MGYGFDTYEPGIQHIVTETYDQYANRRRWEAEQRRRVEWFNLKLLLGGMFAFFVFMGIMFAVGA